MDHQAKNMLDLGPEGLSKGDIETSLTLTEEEAAREQHNAVRGISSVTSGQAD